MKFTKHMALELQAYKTHKKVLDKYKELNGAGVIEMLTGTAITRAIYAAVNKPTVVYALVGDDLDHSALEDNNKDFVVRYEGDVTYPFHSTSNLYSYAIPINAVGEVISQAQAEFNSIVKLSGLALLTALIDNGLTDVTCKVSDTSLEDAITRTRNTTTISSINFEQMYPFGIWKFAIPVGKNRKPFVGTVYEYLRDIA